MAPGRTGTGAPQAGAAASSSMRYAQVRTAATAAAATATAATTALTQPAAPQTAVVPGGTPPGGTVYSSRQVTGDDEPPGKGGRPHRLRIGSHTVSYATVARLGVPTPGVGMVLGADRDNQRVQIRFFRAETTRVTMVGDVWAAQLLAFRSLALGARVVVITVEPDLWNGLGTWATGRNDRVAVLGAETAVALTGTAQEPTLLIYDLGTTGPTAPPLLGPWRTQLTLLRRLEPAGLPELQSGHLVMLKRLSHAEATLSAGPLRLSDQSVRLLQIMEDDMVALLGGGADRYLWLSLTSIERQFAGAGRR
jgi:hypothetical protein